ncbi:MULTISPECIES: TonB-dependent receptor [Alteromonas]|jgi:outer membrane receptor protein involved in Fe transport|uniref:TonB-dependent receptor n=1 Tax=Alteromonas macleodii (strain English Channel 673) TaxID=1004788 RepID=A0AB32ZW29_ALTME|nr:TonB-dependent receptor [Alteromonas macleodii]MCH2258122.1 TonB-dependent receptor [Alteromonas sp.]MED5334350.1 TonB-dependent receptor [Pseudomonadota bacterium]AFT73764.1 TonB-dependent receptor [Alteromonas macleodii str. 'English Channel 673']MBL3808722.1 TonB-dependent receptor [Alteromonas macleodii]MBL3882259.1 TonB-dependent receptor [Alteromonas macleodii]|tara:strand:- start:336 stop:2426 length:2091 start_codon:yes stop_codon:yes gene_type:complete
MYKTLFTLSLLASSVAAYAQQTNVSNTSDSTPSDIERVIVSGDFRQTTLDQLSASATILDQERLRSRQPSHIDSVLNSIPNVNFAAGASRGRFVQIRGIGERSQFAEPINPSVSFIVDEFDFSGLAAAGLIFDTKQLEVYRGPQATLYGTGALAGAVKLSSNDVGSDAPDYVEARIGNKESYRIEGATGDDINTDWGYRVALVHNRSDGFVENTFLNRSDTANIDETALRFAVEGSVDERTTLALTYRWYDIDNGYDAFSLDNDNKTLSDEPGFDEHQTHAVSARSTTNTAAGDFILIATHASHNIAYGYDEDWTFTGFHPWGYTSFDAYYRDVETQTGEMRFVSSDSAALFDGMTDWTIGVFYKSTEEKLLRQYTYLDSDFASEYTPTTTAIYAQTESRLNENLVLVAGLRVENYDFDYADNNQLTRAFDTTMVGGKVALQYTQGDHFYYGSISRGYKGAGFNPDSRVNDNQRFFDEEYNWNYEVGVKGPLLTPDLIARAAIFYMDRKDTQVSDFDVITRDDGTAGFVDIIDNADLGTNKGAELELSWIASDAWQLDASVGYLSATFEGYTLADGTEVSEQRQAQSPKWTANLYSEYALTDNMLWRVDVDYKSEYRFSDGHDVTSPSTTLVNSEIVVLHGDWQTSLWVQNAFDREYYTRGFGGFSNDPRDEYAFDEPYYQIGNGRQFGVTVKYAF